MENALALQAPIQEGLPTAASPHTVHAVAPHARPPAWRASRFRVLLAILAALGGSGAGYWAISHHDARETLPDAVSAPSRDADAILVTVEPITIRPVQRSVEAVGTLHGFEEVTLSAKVEGRIRTIYHDMADRVHPGELLIQIDPTDCDLTVQQAERALQVELAKLGLDKPPGPAFDLAHVPTVEQAHARMENALAKLERQRRLLTSRAVSTEEFDNGTSDYRTAQAEFSNQQMMARSGLATIQMKQTMLAVARQQLKDTEVHAPTPSQPVPGAEKDVTYGVTLRSVSEGTYVKGGNEVYRLVLDQTLKLRVPVPERHGAEVKVGQKAAVTSAAFAQPFAGMLTRVNPSVDPVTRTFEVEIQVPNPEGKLKPGGFAKAAIFTRLEPESITVPLSALATFGGVTKVFLAENGRARAIPVTLGVQTTEWAEITTPALPRHAEIITSGQTVLASNTPVAIREPAAKRDLQTPSSADSRHDH